MIRSRVVSETMPKPVAHCMMFGLDSDKAGGPAVPVDEKDNLPIRFRDREHVLVEH